MFNTCITYHCNVSDKICCIRITIFDLSLLTMVLHAKLFINIPFQIIIYFSQYTEESTYHLIKNQLKLNCIDALNTGKTAFLNGDGYITCKRQNSWRSDEMSSSNDVTYGPNGSFKYGMNSSSNMNILIQMHIICLQIFSANKEPTYPWKVNVFADRKVRL